MMPAEYHRLKSDSLLTLPPIRVEYLLMNALFNMIVLFNMKASFNMKALFNTSIIKNNS